MLLGLGIVYNCNFSRQDSPLSIIPRQQTILILKIKYFLYISCFVHKIFNYIHYLVTVSLHVFLPLLKCDIKMQQVHILRTLMNTQVGL